MNEREKVIKGLEYHLKELTVGKTCYECPYCGDNPCETQLIANAISLLKEQEPRVLTLDEVRYEYEVVWLETKYLSPTVCLFDNVESNVDWLYFVFGSDDSYGESVHLYGKNWRCWSARPTDEQRKAVKWDD